MVARVTWFYGLGFHVETDKLFVLCCYTMGGWPLLGNRQQWVEITEPVKPVATNFEEFHSLQSTETVRNDNASQESICLFFSPKNINGVTSSLRTIIYLSLVFSACW